MLLKLLFPICVIVIQQTYSLPATPPKDETSEERVARELRLRKYAYIDNRKIFNPTKDYIFKKIFSDQSVLLEFVNSVLGRADDKLFTSVEYLDKDYTPDSFLGRPVILDILCRTNTKEEIIVEMQVRREVYFLNRAFFYVCKTYTNQYDTSEYYKSLQAEEAKKKGKQPTMTDLKSSANTRTLSKMDTVYEALKPVHLIAFTDHILFPSPPGSVEKCEKFMSTHLLLDNSTHENKMKQCSVTYIELPKMKNCDPSTFTTVAEKISYFFFFRTNDEEYKTNLLKLKEKNKCIEKMFKITDETNWTPGEKILYNWSLFEEDRRHDEIVTSNLDAKAEGKVEGVRETKIEIARNMLENPEYKDDTIKKLTGLSLDEIAKLKPTQ